MCDENRVPIYGMKMGELLYDSIDGEGQIVLNNDFALLDNVTQMDLLVDWRAMLDNLYNTLCYICEEEENGL